MLTLLAKLLKAFNSDDNPSQIALAVVLAAFLGLTPLLTPHNFFVLLLLLIIRCNLSMFFLSFGMFTLVAYAFDPISHVLGLTLLNSSPLTPLWTILYNNSFWRFMAFNNSLVLGSLTLCIILAPILFIASRLIVVNYRSHIMTWIKKTRAVTWLKGSKLYTAYINRKN